MRAALAARSAGARVLMVGKRLIGRSGSSAVTTGGYAAARSDINPDDNAHLHFIDTVIGGGYVNDRKLAQALADDAPARLQELWGFGAQFRKRNGRYHLSPSGDHTQARVFVPEHMRGMDLTVPMQQAAIDAGVEFLEDCVILELLRDDGRVVGAVGVGRIKIDGYIVRAGATVLAAGGAGRLFSVTSNPIDVCGGGYALALRAGARLRDMEFIQFYPWRLIRPFKFRRVPIQPSTFVIGGRLYNSRGERFMEKYDPVKKESAMRDVSARGIADQIRLGLAVEGGVILDVSQISDDQFRYENSKVVDLLDPKRINYRDIQLIVAPEAHFFMGGVAIDEYGQSNLRGLYAAGENAGGVHGGNRLNSNSIPDTQVFGYRAGLTAAQTAAAGKVKLGDPGPIENVAGFLKGMTSPGDAAAAYAPQLDQLRNAMMIDLGIVRTPDGLNRAIATALDVRTKTTQLPILNQGDLIARRELEDLCTTAVACATSALHRTESRASHYRSDFPDTDPAWVRTVIYDSSGVSTCPVEVEPDEARWGHLRNAATPAPGKGEKEYIE